MTARKSRFLSRAERAARIRAAMKIKRITMYRMCKDLGANQSTMTRALSANMTTGTLSMVANYLGVSAGFLMDREVAKTHCPHCKKEL